MDLQTTILAVEIALLGTALPQLYPGSRRFGLFQLGIVAALLCIQFLMSRASHASFAPLTFKVHAPPVLLFVPIAAALSFGVGICAEWRKDSSLRDRLAALALRINRFALESAARMPIINPSYRLNSIGYILQFQNRRKNEYLLAFRDELLEVMDELYRRDLVPKDWQTSVFAPQDVNNVAQYVQNLSASVGQPKYWPRRALFTTALCFGWCLLVWLLWIALAYMFGASTVRQSI